MEATSLETQSLKRSDKISHPYHQGGWLILCNLLNEWVAKGVASDPHVFINIWIIPSWRILWCNADGSLRKRFATNNYISTTKINKLRLWQILNFFSIVYSLKYGFWKKSLRKNATLNSWTIFLHKKVLIVMNHNIWKKNNDLLLQVPFCDERSVQLFRVASFRSAGLLTKSIL